MDWRGGGKESSQVVQKVAVGLGQSGAYGNDESCSNNIERKGKGLASLTHAGTGGAKRSPPLRAKLLLEPYKFVIS